MNPADELLRIMRRLPHKETPTRAAYGAGYLCGLEGASLANCDIRYFATRELTSAWERGRDAGIAERVKRARELG